MTSADTKPDHWTAESYAAAADFVHKLTNTVLKYLAPSPSDHILDLGCGDGKLSVQIAATVPQGRVHGLDASSNFVNFAKSTFPASNYSNLSFERQDCAKLEEYATHNAGAFDKVFSNAALHWIMKEPATRIPTLKNVLVLLKPGGKFVFEMGGAGNVGEVHAALISALVKDGVPIVEAINSSPWFFPSDVLMNEMLTEAGFEVEKVELEYRPTKLEAGAGGGLKGWLELMAADFFDKVNQSKRATIIDEVIEILKPICFREEGGEWVGNVRCRAVARRP